MGEHWLWILFGVVVLGMLTFDILVFCRRPRILPLRQAFAWSLAWVSLAALFAAAVYSQEGSEKGLEFVTGYLIEWSLSMDNLFVFLVIFTYFAVPNIYMHRVLFWGIMLAVILRGIFIAAGLTLLAWFTWVMYVFGAFLIFTGFKLLRQGDEHVEPAKNPILRLFRRFMAVTPEYYEQNFFVRLSGHWLATPLTPVFIVIGTTDIMFAVDSIPAIFAITRDPFIVYTSNVFAVLGLRGLFFLLSGIMGLFRYFKYGLSIVLVFVGIKMLVADFYHISSGRSLAAVVSILGVSILLSIIHRPRADSEPRTLNDSGGKASDAANCEVAPLADMGSQRTVGPRARGI
jgi:tellurite resistance protein TerC